MVWDPEIVSRSPEWRCPFNIGNRYKDDVMTFFGDQNMCPKERFHCNLIVVLVKVTSYMLHIINFP